MKKITPETVTDNNGTHKYYLLCETDATGIHQFLSAPADTKSGVTLSHMRVEESIVPALRFEVDADTYYSYKREEWRQADQARQENRCIICGLNGKSRRCPTRIPNPDYTGTNGEKKTLAVDCNNCPYGYNRLFRPVGGKIFFSTLDVTDTDGNCDPYEPQAPSAMPFTAEYMQLLLGFIDYINVHYPKYAKYTQLLYLLGLEIPMREATEIISRPQTTMYDFLKKVRTIYDEYSQTIISL